MLSSIYKLVAILLVTVGMLSSLSSMAVEIEMKTTHDEKPIFDESLKRQLTPDLVEKLSGEQIAKVLHDAMAYKDRGVFDEDVLVPVSFFALVFAIFLIFGFLKLKRHREQQETIRLMIEKGAVIPPEMLVEKNTLPGRSADLRRGILLLSIGLGATLAFIVGQGVDHAGWAVSLIPCFIGFGYILSSKIVSHESEESGM